MQNRVHALLISILLGGAVLALAPGAARGPIGFVNVQKCMDQDSAVSEELLKLQEAAEAALESFQKREASLNEARSELVVMDRASAEFRLESFRLEEAQNALNRESEFTSSELSGKKAELLLRAWSRIRNAASRIADEEGLDAIQVIWGPIPGPEAGLDARFQAMKERKTLWVRPECDITAQVLEALAVE